MQAIHAPLIRQSGITYVLYVERFSSRERASIVVAGGQRVRVYELLNTSDNSQSIGASDGVKEGGLKLRKVYDQVWGGDISGLASVRTVASAVDGRERVVVGFGGKVSLSFLVFFEWSVGRWGDCGARDFGEEAMASDRGTSHENHTSSSVSTRYPEKREMDPQVPQRHGPKGFLPEEPYRPRRRSVYPRSRRLYVVKHDLCFE
jgi:hypothetical protein